MKITLIGLDETVHGQGIIKDEIVNTLAIIIRNDRYYVFDKFSLRQGAFYQEAEQPYRMNEF